MGESEHKRAMRTLYHFAIAAFMAIILSLPAHAATETASPNYQGLWWNSPPESESGWGINVAHQGDILFATWFTYDANGGGWWLSMTADKVSEGVYSGTLIETRGPAFSAVPFDPAKVTRLAVGTGTFTFRDIDSGTFSYTVHGVQETKFITRLAFGPLPACAAAAKTDLATATNYQDLWWSGSAESGWGINLTHQGDSIFVTWFTYGADGKPLWLSATATKVAPGVYSGQLIRTTGPAFKAATFDPAKVTRTVVGSATLTFDSGNAGTFAYTVDGVTQSKAITRMLFAPDAGTRCGAPLRALTSFQVVAVGDIAQCGAKPASESAAAWTAQLVRPDDALVLTLGDNVYESGTPEEFANCFHPTWGAFKDRIRPAPGNHEYNTSGAAGYYNYFGDRAGPDRRGYYSFDHGGWHFISLNGVTDISPQSEQVRWLADDLEKSRHSLCTIAVVHYPAFNSGSAHGSSYSMRPLFAMLHDAGVEMVLSGHEHVYERFAPQTADGTADPVRGVRQFVVGTGGGTLHSFGPPLPNSEFRYGAGWGVLRLTLGQGTYDWSFVPAGGGPALDSGTARCHR